MLKRVSQPFTRSVPEISRISVGNIETANRYRGIFLPKSSESLELSEAQFERCSTVSRTRDSEL